MMNGRRSDAGQTLALICALVMASLRSEAQGNLVPNPSFEDADTCAVQMGYLPNGKPQHWFRVSDTPDYYRSCVPAGSVNAVPQSVLVYQFPFEGDSYSGMYTYFFDGFNFREMIAAELTDPLDVGETYYASMYVNAGTGGIGAAMFGACSNNIGMLFTLEAEEWLEDMPPFGLRNYAQVFSQEVITDTLGWTLVSGSFVADSAYRYIVIGNHFTDEYTVLDTIAVGVYDRAYMPVDMICVSTDPEGCPMTTGVRDQGLLSLSLYPNPVVDLVHLSGLQGSYRDVVITDAVGRRVWSGSVRGLERWMLDVASWPAGQYMLLLNGEAGRRSLRFVVMR